jgi:hypothetical protein
MFSAQKFLPISRLVRYLSPLMEQSAPAPIPPPPRGMGCFAKGCLTLLVAAVVLVIVCLFGGWFILNRLVDQFTGTQPQAIEVLQPTPGESRAAEAKAETLRNAIRSNQEAIVEFTASDLNALIANDPDFHRAHGRVRVAIVDSIVALDVSAPLNSLKWSRLQRRWFNGNVRFGMNYSDGDFSFDLKSAEANGHRLPHLLFTSDFERSFNRSFNERFRSNSEKHRERDEWFKHIKTISVQNDKVIVTTRQI